MTGAPPRDFTILLPPGWVRIPLDGSETARVTALAAAKAASAPAPVRDRVRRRLIRVLRDTLRQAKAAGGVDVLVSLAESRGLPVAASCLVTYQDRGQQVPLDGLLAELAGAGGDVTVTEIAGAPAVRRRACTAAPSGDASLAVSGRAASGRAADGWAADGWAADSRAEGGGDVPDPGSLTVTVVDYFLPVPGRTGLLSLSFSTPVEPLADALVLLFDAIAGSFRWIP